MTHFVDRSIRVRLAWLAALVVLGLPGVRSQAAAQTTVAETDKDAIVFIGASSIVRWHLDESFPELGPEAIKAGFGGSLAADSTRYADRIPPEGTACSGRPAHDTRRLRNLERRAQTDSAGQPVKLVVRARAAFQSCRRTCRN